MKKYKVLFIDDNYEAESIQDFASLAYNKSIDLIFERYHLDGMELLKKDVNYDIQAVILDATGFLNKEDNEYTNIGLKHSLNTLKDLSTKRQIPWFVYTGASRNSTSEFLREIGLYQKEIKYGREALIIYTKTLHENELLEDVVIEINQVEKTSVLSQYKEVLEIAKELHFTPDDLSILREILCAVHLKHESGNSIYLNTIRKMVEYVYRGLYDSKILHEKCIDENGKINLSESTYFLSGQETKHLKIKSKKPHFPLILSFSIKNVNHIAAASSHTTNQQASENLNYQMYQQEIPNSYLLHQLVFTVCDLILWYKNYTLANPDPAINQSFWEDIIEPEKIVQQNKPNWIEGKIEKLNQDGSGFFISNDAILKLRIPPYLVMSDFKQDSAIKITTKNKIIKHIDQLELIPSEE